MTFLKLILGVFLISCSACQTTHAPGTTRKTIEIPAEPKAAVPESSAMMTLTEREGGGWNVQVVTPVKVSREIAWATLTDYDHHPSFIPTILESRKKTVEGKPRVDVLGS